MSLSRRGLPPSRFLHVLALLTALLVPLTAAQPAPEQPATVPSLSAARPFTAGERLTYALSWLNLRAGTAVLDVSASQPLQDRPTLQLLTTAQSSALLSTFYPVDNRIESLVDAATLVPQRTIFRRREGKRKNDFDVTFRHAEGTALSIKDGAADTVPIPAATHDALSCLYYLRSLPTLVPGSSHVINIHHDKKNYRLEVRVEGLERMRAPWGEVETVRVLAIMPFKGIFLNEGNIRVWLTNDVRHIPVMMKAKVIIGSVVARLIDGAGSVPKSPPESPANR